MLAVNFFFNKSESNRIFLMTHYKIQSTDLVAHFAETGRLWAIAMAGQNWLRAALFCLFSHFRAQQKTEVRLWRHLVGATVISPTVHQVTEDTRPCFRKHALKAKQVILC